MRSCSTILLAVIGFCALAWCLIHRNVGPHAAADSGWQSDIVHVSKAVDYRYFAEGAPEVKQTESDALVLDIDLSSPTVRLQVTADNPIRRKGGKVFGVSHTVRDWCAMNRAIAGVNGGFFGQTDADGVNKQAEGLLVVDGTVYNAGRWVKSTRKPNETFLRCALGIRNDGLPQIGWATCQPDGEMRMYDRPLSPSGSKTFNISSAVACGPRLMVAGKEQVTDSTERLVSDLPLPRTFIAYDYASQANNKERKPRHFVMGIAMQMTYHDVAQFLQSYFRKHHNSDCAEAMCLDGGSSSQLVYQSPSQGKRSASASPDNDWIDARPSHVTVPTALLVVHGR